MAVTLNTKHLGSFVKEQELTAIAHQVQAAHELVHNRNGLGNDYLGWLDLPVDYDKEEFVRIQAAAKKIQSNSQVLVVIGIGGSYLGARAAIELLHSPLYNLLPKETPEIYFAGCSISPTYLNEIIRLCEGKDFSVNVISKSGTTTEPALAFRVFRDLLIKKYGEEGAKERIFCTTDKARGTLKTLADREGYETFVIPDDVGGRYSVLTAVGLLPIAVSGADISKLMEGAAAAREHYSVCDLASNDCYRYAALRNILNRRGKSIELLVSYEPSFAMMAEWYKQLFGESEGKDGKGLYPSSVIFSTDLHSMGQFIQEGSRVMFETVVDIQKAKQDLFIPADEENFDGLNFLANQNMSVVNHKAMQGTILAHTEGAVPNLILEVPEINEYELGQMIYFFEKACAISGYMLGINPFDQPGVESYKRNMFALLGKPGYENEKAALEEKLK
ncbi:MAG: glucose-6-phosphate isomerase [Oscillospiraceae bacterium]|nr:glucose-6-phosphate isomerase [Oscillospiraceae bacterium]